MINALHTDRKELFRRARKTQNKNKNKAQDKSLCDLEISIMIYDRKIQQKIVDVKKAIVKDMDELEEELNTCLGKFK